MTKLLLSLPLTGAVRIVDDEGLPYEEDDEDMEFGERERERKRRPLDETVSYIAPVILSQREREKHHR